MVDNDLVGLLGIYAMRDIGRYMKTATRKMICPLSSRQVKYGSLSTVVGDEKLTSREDLIGLLFFYVQNDEDTFLKVDEVSKTEAQPFDVFNQLVGSFQFCV